MSYVGFTTPEIVKIEMYLELGFFVQKIAGRLGRQPSMISRELRRNTDYDACHADKRYVERKKKCGAPTKFTPGKKVRTLEKLRETWSPEQITGHFPQKKDSRSRRFFWIYMGLVNRDSGLLRQKGKHQKPHETRKRQTADQ